MMKTVAVDASTQNPYPWTMFTEHYSWTFSQCQWATHCSQFELLMFFVKRPMWWSHTYLVIAPRRTLMHHFIQKFMKCIRYKCTIWNSYNWGRNEFKNTYTMYIQISVHGSWFFIWKSSDSRRDYLHTIKYAAHSDSVLKRPVSLCKVLINFFICNEKLLRI